MSSYILEYPSFSLGLHHTDKNTYEKIQRHLSDINDTITEEDIRNVQIGFPFIGNEMANTLSSNNNSDTASK